MKNDSQNAAISRASLRLPRNLPPIQALSAPLCDDDSYSSVRFVKLDLSAQRVEHLLFESAQFEHTSLSQTSFLAPRFTNVHFEECDLANAAWERATIHRAEFFDSKWVGLKLPEAHLRDVFVRNCRGQYLHCRFATLKSVTFQDCDLSDADFQGSDLTGVRFIHCNLTNAEFSQTKLSGADFRGSQIDHIKVGPHELPGAIVDPVQAAYLASLLGLVVKSEQDE
jgi:uncharacterized protein YjbI with pentapeptide repeats